jgi:hypothetical protein
MMGSPLVVLNNADVAADLLERRSVIYSDKVVPGFSIPLTTPGLTATYCQPRMPMVNELCVPSHSSVAAPTNHDLFQDGMLMVIRRDALQ